MRIDPINIKAHFQQSKQKNKSHHLTRTQEYTLPNDTSADRKMRIILADLTALAINKYNKPVKHLYRNHTDSYPYVIVDQKTSD